MFDMHKENQKKPQTDALANKLILIISFSKAKSCSWKKLKTCLNTCGYFRS